MWRGPPRAGGGGGWAGRGPAAAAFDALSYTHRREYAEWIAQAKKEKTRERRAARAVEMLKAGDRHP
jgi:uncharacterized protein YdeI (YjbR/CyaY-like superfamily)